MLVEIHSCNVWQYKENTYLVRTRTHVPFDPPKGNFFEGATFLPFRVADYDYVSDVEPDDGDIMLFLSMKDNVVLSQDFKIYRGYSLL